MPPSPPKLFLLYPSTTVLLFALVTSRLEQLLASSHHPLLVQIFIKEIFCLEIIPIPTDKTIRTIDYSRDDFRIFTLLLCNFENRLCLGILYPAYASYKAIRNKAPKDYVKWMMYWVVFALFSATETFTDIFLAFWFPFYYEIKILIVLWLMMPATRGSSVLYRKFVHPLFTQHENELDAYIERAKTDGYTLFREFSGIALQYMATFVVMATAALQSVAHRSTHALKKDQVKKELKLTESQSEPAFMGEEEEEQVGVRTRRGGRRGPTVTTID